jgi:hypothetical protein
MKTQIIQLEPHDDHISIRDKMNWSKTPRILLVLPRRRKFDLNLLDLKLLQRHAHALGAELGLVTKSQKIIRSANALGIPVFSDNLAAQREVWSSQRLAIRKKRRPKRNLRARQASFRREEATWRKHPLARQGAFALATLALLALAFAFIPKARVEIQPQTRTQSISIPVRADLNIDEVFLSGSIPAYRLRATLTEERSLPASGRVAVPAQVARGSVVFRNLTDTPIRIPAGTVVRSVDDESLRFVTLQSAEVDGEINAEAEVPVKSLVFGKRGNLAPNTLQAIEGELGLWLAATNPEPTGGGKDSYVSAPTKQDRDDLRAAVMAHFYQEAENKVRQELAAGDVVFPDSLGEIEVLEENYDPPEGETGDRLTLTMRASIEILYAKETDMRELAQLALAASIPKDFSPVPNSLNISSLSDFETQNNGITVWQMRVEQKLRPKISATQVAALIQGHGLEAASRILEEHYNLESPPVISVSPSWWKRLPLAPFRIEIITR